jgi:uncharacterized protein
VIMRKKLVFRVSLFLISGYLLFSIAAGIALAELQLHPLRRQLRESEQVAHWIRSQYGADLQKIELKASDGVLLKAWYVRPPNSEGRNVLLLHGVGDNREGMAGFAPELLAHGYGVLLPDSRAHGESGGAIATYGLHEADDVHRWVSWLYARQHSKCVYGFGESMGAAIVLDSLTAENRFCAVVAESPFSSFRSVAYERAALYVKMPTWFGESVLRLPVQVGITYAKLRYGLDFDKDSPIHAVGQSSTPILLIHGSKDTNILPHHSQWIAAAYPTKVQFWEVPGAAHCGASQVQPELFWPKVLGWFETHPGEPLIKSSAEVQREPKISVKSAGV